MLTLFNLQAFLVSTGVVALAEIGDKTQLLSLLLAARFRQPGTIVAGILIATLVNHAFAGAVGTWITQVVGPDALSVILGLSFIAMALWTLVPDTYEESESTTPRFGVLGTTIGTFFLAEMGDKTQVATVALAAQYNALLSVVIGTTFGMLIANVPVVLVGERLAQRLPVRPIQRTAALVFAVLGGAALLNAKTFIAAGVLVLQSLPIVQQIQLTAFLDHTVSLLVAGVLGALIGLGSPVPRRTEHVAIHALAAIGAAAFVHIGGSAGAGTVEAVALAGGLFAGGIRWRGENRPEGMMAALTLWGTVACGATTGADQLLNAIGVALLTLLGTIGGAWCTSASREA